MEVSFKNNSKRYLKALKDAIEKSADAIGLQAEGNAIIEIQTSPVRVDTGLLKNSITYALGGQQPSKMSYRADRIAEGETEYRHGDYKGTAPKSQKRGETDIFLGSNVEYAEYVHDGTQRLTPNRFLKRAITKHTNDYRKIIIENLKDG